MIKKILYMALPLVAIQTSAQALTPVFSDSPQNVQQALIEGQNAVAVAQTQLTEVQTLKTTALNGYAGVKNTVSNLDQVPQMYLSSFESKANGLVSDTMQSVLGKDIVGSWSARDLMDLDLDKIKQLTEKELTGLTQEQLKGLLGEQLSSKLSASQIQDIAQDPKKALSLLNGLSTAKQVQQGAQSKPSKGLEGLGMKGVTKLNTTSVQTTSMGPDGNRSDAFNGTGNASTAQFAESQEVFTEMRNRIENKLQLPKTKEDMLNMTSAQAAEIALLQTEAQKELGIQGLSTAWIRQEVTKQRLPKQEEAIAKLFNEKATDERGTIQVISALSIMTAEAQNYASTVYAVDLTASGTQINKRTGSSSTPVLSKEELGDTDTASIGTTPTNGEQQGSSSKAVVTTGSTTTGQ